MPPLTRSSPMAWSAPTGCTTPGRGRGAHGETLRLLSLPGPDGMVMSRRSSPVQRRWRSSSAPSPVAGCDERAAATSGGQLGALQRFLPWPVWARSHRPRRPRCVDVTNAEKMVVAESRRAYTYSSTSTITRWTRSS